MDEDEFDLPLQVHEDGNEAVSKPEMRERKLQLRDQFHKRENRRIRNSVSFRLGVLLTRSVRRPWTLLLLPITMLNLFLNAWINDGRSKVRVAVNGGDRSKGKPGDSKTVRQGPGQTRGIVENEDVIDI